MHPVKKSQTSKQSFSIRIWLLFFFFGTLLIRRLVCPHRLTFSGKKRHINFLLEIAERALPFEFDIIFVQLI